MVYLKTYKTLALLTLGLLLFPLVNQAMNVTFHYGVYMTSEFEPYVETYLRFNGSDLAYATLEDSTFQASLEVTLIFKSSGEIKSFSKNIVQGPISNDPVNEIRDFVDQQRFSLENGNYDLTIQLVDINNRSDSIISVQKIDVKVDPKDVGFSDVFLVDRSAPGKDGSIYQRSGLNLYPKISPLYASDANELQFYCELYNADKSLGSNEDYLITIEIVNPNTDEVVGQFRSIQRKKAQPVTAILQRIDISSLPSGSYILLIQAIDRSNKPIAARSLPIKRFNVSENNMTLRSDPSETFVARIDEDSLRTICYCMIYQGSDAEVNYIENQWKKAEYSELQRFFYAFWQDRNQMDPELEWRRYQRQIKHVEQQYSNNTQHGCGTDRGRIYLKYGEPNSMSIVRNESRAYPYEIWHYYRIPEKSNAKFFFLDTKRINEYILAHSNVAGEPFDRLWYTRLVRETMGGSQSAQERNEEIMGTDVDPYSYGSRALDYWNNPR